MDIKQITSYLLWNHPEKFDKISRLEFFEYVEKIYGYNIEKLNFFWEQANKYEEDFYKLTLEKFYSQSRKDDLEKAKLERLLKELWLPWLDKDEKLVLWSYKDEEDFTKNFLLDFFKKLWYKDVRYNHGTDEKWKDIVMKIKNSLWEYKYIWVQAKIWNIDAIANKNWITNIITQAVKCFSNDYDDIETNKKVRMSEYFIVTNWEITEKAKDEILAIEPTYFKNNIHFIDKTKIENMLDEMK